MNTITAALVVVAGMGVMLYLGVTVLLLNDLRRCPHELTGGKEMTPAQRKAARRWIVTWPYAVLRGDLRNR